MVTAVIRMRGINKVQAKGRVYYYHRKSGTRLTAEFGSPEFLAELRALNAKKAPPPRTGTLDALIAGYRASPEFVTLAPRTRRDYQRVFDWLHFTAHAPIDDFDGERALKLRDKAFKTKKRRFANYLIQVGRLLWKWGKPRNLSAPENPWLDVEMIRRPRDARRVNRAWTEHEIATVMAAAPAELRLAIALGVYVGMREGDALRLAWAAYDGAWIRWTQGKTGNPLDVPAHKALRALLNDAATRKRSPVIVVGARGRPFTETGFRSRFFKLIRALAADPKHKIGSGLTFHGLRHTATKNLLDAGCDPRTVMAIIGHKSEAAFAVYAGEADQRRRAKQGIAKLERSTIIR